MPDVVIVGAGGHGREVLDALLDTGQHCLGFLDDQEPDEELLRRVGARWLGPVSLLADMPQDTPYLIGIGSGELRRKIDALASDRRAWTLVHPRACVGRDVRLSPGVVIFATATVTTNITIGRHTHIGRGAAVGHDSVLGDYVTIHPNAAISGSVTLGDEVTIGTTASVLQELTVGVGAMVGSGAAVVRDVPAGVTVVGVPARPR